MILLLILVSVLSPTFALLHPARQIFTSMQDICGATAIDCGNGWCCLGGQQCIPPSQGPGTDPECMENLLTDIGGDPLTLPAYPFSSLQSADSSFASLLSSMSITLSTVPTTLPTTGSFTALTSYSDNTLRSYKMPPTPTAVSTVSAATTTPTSTGAAARRTGAVGWGVMGVVGVGMAVGFA
ncbi:hypothetical protein GQ43DRAFT_55897 [Delitschia confertaspora ATCC 74209]|uniref:Uncharacterized protein n=1 Tax=Delitschia confertaspora ATCC 74209 TaxID=1513339 RepID=A0A9P4JPI6_9PLEO|nr:hypothetical protein GQ43DRAFT_55897 [Delitschia confertaspora ATCC 74209]